MNIFPKPLLFTSTNQRKLHAPKRVAVRGETPYEPIKFPIPAGIGGLSAIATTRWCAHSDPVPVGLGALEGSIVKVSYSEKLKDPRWQKKRLEILQRDRFACVACHADSKTLHVHHCYYVGRREPWDYPNASLLTLCEKCHGEADNLESNAHSWTTFWEFAVGIELDRARWNSKLANEDAQDEGALWSFCAQFHRDVPVEEALNTLALACNQGVFTYEMLLELGRRASEKLDASKPKEGAHA